MTYIVILNDIPHLPWIDFISFLLHDIRKYKAAIICTTWFESATLIYVKYNTVHLRVLMGLYIIMIVHTQQIKQEVLAIIAFLWPFVRMDVSCAFTS